MVDFCPLSCSCSFEHKGVDFLMLCWSTEKGGGGGSHPFLDNKFFTLSRYKASTMRHQTVPTPLWGYVFKNV